MAGREPGDYEPVSPGGIVAGARIVSNRPYSTASSAVTQRSRSVCPVGSSRCRDRMTGQDLIGQFPHPDDLLCLDLDIRGLSLQTSMCGGDHDPSKGQDAPRPLSTSGQDHEAADAALPMQVLWTPSRNVPHLANPRSSCGHIRWIQRESSSSSWILQRQQIPPPRGTRGDGNVAPNSFLSNWVGWRRAPSDLLTHLGRPGEP